MKQILPPTNNWKKISLMILILQIAIYFPLLATGTKNIQDQNDISKVNVSLEMKNVKLVEVLNEIDKQTDFSFFYEEGLTHNFPLVSVTAKNKTLESVLYDLAEAYQLKFKQINNQISVNKASIIQKNNVLEVKVKGNVVDDNGFPLPGVSIVVKGTTIGTVTDLDGNYSLEGIPEGGVLVFSFIGFQSQEIAVNGQSSIDIKMVMDTQSLNEVVVVGYGEVNRRDLTGAIAKVDIDQQEEMSNVNFLQSLQGSVPGLNIGQVNQAGQAPSLSIRGQNTLSSNGPDNRPLVVLDGIIYRGTVADIASNTIESVEVLKDASAAAVYGSQAANGVILITTKKGKTIGKPVISYSGQYSSQSPTNDLQPYNAADNKVFTDNAYWMNSRLEPDYLQPNPDFSIIPFLKTSEIAEGYQNGRDNDWWGMFTGNGQISSHNVSVRGRTEKSGYFISGGYTDQQGFVKNDEYNRIDIKANFDTEINDWIKFGMESFMVSSDYSGVAPGISNLFHLQPYAPIYDEKGDYVLLPNGIDLNPFLAMDIDDSDKRLNLFGNFHFDVKLPFLKGFNYRVNYGHNFTLRNHDQFNPYGANFTGTAYKNSSNFYSYVFDNIFSYKRTFNNIHKLNLTLLYGVENINTSNTNASAKNFVNPTLGYNRLQAGDPSLNIISSNAEKETSLYNMARAMYTLKDRYVFTATVRRDGFSGFGSKSKFGTFPSVAAGWVLSEESFFKNNTVNFMKLRASYGQTGRRGVSRYQTLARVGSGPSVIFGDGGTATIGQWITSMANDKLKWETTTGLNLGTDFELFNSRLYGNFEYYKNSTENILYNIQIPQITGFTSISTNIGKVANHGIEFKIGGKLIEKKDFSWDAAVNFSRNRNEIVSIIGADNDADGVEDDIISNGLFIGQPQNVVYSYNVVGMWQLEDEIPSGFLPGTYKLEDLNNDGKITPTDDRKILGYTDPSYRFGISNTFKYKGFSLYAFINSIQGGKNYYLGTDTPYTDINQFDQSKINYNNSIPFNYWMPENPNGKYRRLDTNSSIGGRIYDQRNFIRLQDVSLAYTFSPEILEKLRVRRLKFYVSGKNLLTVTKWEGWDPETNTGLVAGLPVMKSYTVGLNVEF